MSFSKYNTKQLWLQEHLILIIVCQIAFLIKLLIFKESAQRSNKIRPTGGLIEQFY